MPITTLDSSERRSVIMSPSLVLSLVGQSSNSRCGSFLTILPWSRRSTGLGGLGVLGEGEVGPGTVVVGEVRVQRAVEVGFVRSARCRSADTTSALRCTSWQIRHHPEDVPRQLDRAERVLDRYEA